MIHTSPLPDTTRAASAIAVHLLRIGSLCLLAGCGGGAPDECEAEASVGCVDGDLYWFDSCGEQGELAIACADCEICADGEGGPACEPAERESWRGCGADGDVHWFDSCGAEGALVETCLDCQVCAWAPPGPAACQAAVEQSHQQCGADDDVHWIDSCGEEREVAIDCDPCSPCVDSSDTSAGCVALDDFTACELITAPDRSYDICVDGVCVSPGCGDPGCNVPGPHFPLADTNQRQCYDAAGAAGCPAAGEPYHGQDAQHGWDALHVESARFAVDATYSGQPVVLDLVTGLDWQGCPEGQSQVGCASGYAHALPWSDALAACDALDWGGHDDWRLPDEYELMSILDLGQAMPSADAGAFPATPPDGFWTSSRLVGGELVAVVHFDWGGVSFQPQVIPHAARCVRGQPAPVARRYETASVAGDRVVLDQVTGLMWQDIATPLLWEAALAYCEGLVWAQHDDWQLPDVKQLRSIVDNRTSFPALDQDTFSVAPTSTYSSSSTQHPAPTGAWTVDFDDGQVYGNHKLLGDQAYVRCVRDGSDE